MEYKKDGFDNQRAIVLPKSIKEILINNELTRLLYVTDIAIILKPRDTIAHAHQAPNNIF